MAESTAKIEITTPSDREIRMTRTFNAPRHLVFEAHTKCEHLERWFGPRSMTMSVCEMDFRNGGHYRFVHTSPDGQEFGFRGEYREIVPPDHITWTFEFEGMPGHVSVETMTLTEVDGKTTLTAVAVYDSKEDRDGMLNSGMEEGSRESYERLDELLATMA